MEENKEHDELIAEIERRSREQEEQILFERFISERRRVNFQRRLLVSVIFAALAGAALNYFYEAPSPLLSQLQRAVSFVFPLIALVVAALAYLQPSAAPRPVTNTEEIFVRTRFYLDKRLEDLKATLGATAAQSFSEADRAKVIANIQTKLESEALSSYVAGIHELVTANVKRASIEQLFKSIAERLGREVQDQAKRGNLNLILGILTTLIGLMVLAYFVPRVSLVMLIEVFAYFFLKLYKQSLSEIKYFQNEITNVESSHLAIQFAKDPDTSLQLKIVEELMQTERNFLMSKDQTTIDIERERLSRSTYSELINAIKDIGKKSE